MLDRSDSRDTSTRTRRGAAANRLAIALGVAVALIAGIVFLVGRSRDKGAPVAGPAHAGTTTPAAHDTPLSEVALPPRGPGDASSEARREFGPADYAGRGRVRGELIVAPGVAYPAVWTLVLEPHPWMSGSEHAVRKRVELTHGERTFEVPDLPLGGYRVRAEAPGVNSTDQAILLVKSSADPFVTLELRPAGLIDGRVFAADGAPAEGLEVVLEPKLTQVRMHTRVGADAAYAFHDVIDGDYILYIGVPEAPLFPPGDIAFTAPALRFPDRTLPPTGAIEIATLDDAGSPVGAVEITGSGVPKGSLRITSGADGRARARWLPPGTYRLEARSLDGRRAKATVEVPAENTSAGKMSAGKMTQVTLRLLDR